MASSNKHQTCLIDAWQKTCSYFDFTLSSPHKRRVSIVHSLYINNIFEKLDKIEDSVHKALMGWHRDVPEKVHRDVQVLNVKLHPAKKGLSFVEGQARLLHDLANIELQAMELALRTLIEFPDSPKLFREQLAEITLSEAQHLKLCLQALDKLGYKWGHWPIHDALWEATSTEDSILDRILIVHRYLEGSGLDAGDSILRKLYSLNAPIATPVLKIIVEEEVGHVQFGSHWYNEICKTLEVNPEYDFRERLNQIAHKVPKRLEKMNLDLRKKSGFADYEIDALVDFQNQQKARIYKNFPIES